MPKVATSTQIKKIRKPRKRKLWREQLAHSPLGASNCERWWNCPGSVDLIKRAPKERPSFYAGEGTVAHALASDFLMGKAKHPLNRVGEYIEQGGFSVHVSEEMAIAVTTYIDYVTARAEEFGLLDDQILTEHRISIPIKEADAGQDKLFGTADRIHIAPFNLIDVIDYKHGIGVTVDVKGNKQALYYGLGAYLAVPEDVRDEITKVVLTIVQPRAPFGGIKTWEAPVSALLEFREELIEAVARVKPGAALKAGSWCKFCPAKPICPAIREQAFQEAVVDFEEIQLPAVEVKKLLPVPAKLSVKQVEQFLLNAPLLEDLISAMWQYAHTLAEGGAQFESLKLVDKKKHRKFSDALAVRKKLRESGLAANDYAPRKLLTPAQIEKMIAQKMPGRTKEKIALRKVVLEAVSEYVFTPQGGKKLVLITDKRRKTAPSVVTDFDEIVDVEAREIEEEPYEV